MSDPKKGNPIEMLQSQPKAKRQIHTWKIPKGVPGSIRKIAMVQLAVNQQFDAAGIAGTSQTKFITELAKASLVGYAEDADAEKFTMVSLGDGSADKLWKPFEEGGMHSKLRELVLLAYKEIHTPSEEDNDAFLKSAEVTVL